MLRVTPLSGFGIGLAAAGGSPGAVTGTMAATEAVDTAIVNGSVIGVVTGTLSVTEAADAAALNGTVPSESAVFLARTSGLDTTHVNAYTALIDGLVADGVWSKFDVLRIYATQNSTTALLNLKSSSFTAVTHGSPSFTADRGFTGVDFQPRFISTAALTLTRTARPPVASTVSIAHIYPLGISPTPPPPVAAAS